MNVKCVSPHVPAVFLPATSDPRVRTLCYAVVKREKDGGHEGRESAQCSKSNGQSYSYQQVFDILVCVLQLVLRKIFSSNVMLLFSEFLVGAD